MTSKTIFCVAAPRSFGYVDMDDAVFLESHDEALKLVAESKEQRRKNDHNKFGKVLFAINLKLENDEKSECF